MSAWEHLRRGDIDQALSALKDDIRREPSAAKHRIFLFQLFAILGEWPKAKNQLKLAAELQDDAREMLQAYQPLIDNEAIRSETFGGKRSPVIFGEPDEWMALVAEAARAAGQKNYEQATHLRDRALEMAPPCPGSVVAGSKSDGESESSTAKTDFEWIMDADDRLGPLLEAVINGRYFWVPFQRIRNVELSEPVDLRDIVWMPAEFEWTNGGKAVGFIPTRYPGSEHRDDNQLRLARRTEWCEESQGFFQGLGQRTLAADSGDFSLLDVRRIDFAENRAEGEGA